MLQIDSIVHDEEVVINVKGVIDSKHSFELRDKIFEMASRKSHVTLNMYLVDYIGAMGLQVLLDFYETHKRKQEITFIKPEHVSSKLFLLAGLRKLLIGNQ